MEYIFHIMPSFIQLKPYIRDKYKIPVRIAFTLLIIIASVTVPTSSIFGSQDLNTSPFDKSLVPSTPSDPGMVAYYPFDIDLLDYSDYSNHGNEVGYLTFNPGVVGNSVKFDGGSYIEVPDSPSLDLYNEFSISVWLNKEDSGTGGWSVILSKGDTSSLGDESPYALAHSIDGQSPLVRLTQNNSHEMITSDTSNSFGQWYHLTVTWDGYTIQFFIDGILMDTKTWSGTLPNSSASLFIGCDPPGNIEYYKGSMDELRIYNTVLTPVEIDNLFNQGTTIIPEPEPTTTEPTDATPTQVPLLKGDFDSDGKVAVNDALFILQAAVGNRDVIAGMDINGDGAVSSVDARMVLRAALGLEELQ
jgi:hypothetical protein